MKKTVSIILLITLIFSASVVLAEKNPADDRYDLSNFGYRTVKEAGLGALVFQTAPGGSFMHDYTYWDGDRIFVNLTWREGKHTIAYENGVYGYVDASYINWNTSPSTSSTVSASYSENVPYQVTVYFTGTEGLALKAAPDINSQRYLLIPEGTSLQIQKVSGAWGYTAYNGNNGWVYLRYTKIVGDYTPVAPTSGFTDPAYYTVYNTQGEGLELRVMPTTEGSTFGPLYDGTVVKATAVSGEWVFVEVNGRRGWCNTNYLRTSTQPEIGVYKEKSATVSTVPTSTEDPFDFLKQEDLTTAAAVREHTENTTSVSKQEEPQAANTVPADPKDPFYFLKQEESTTVEEPTTEKPKANWSSAYEDFVLEEQYVSNMDSQDSTQQGEFRLFDVNADGIPELFISDKNETASQRYDQLFTYFEDKVVHLGSGAAAYSYDASGKYPGMFGINLGVNQMVVTYMVVDDGQMIQTEVLENSIPDGLKIQTTDQALYQAYQSATGISFPVSATKQDLNSMGWEKFVQDSGY